MIGRTWGSLSADERKGLPDGTVVTLGGWRATKAGPDEWRAAIGPVAPAIGYRFRDADLSDECVILPADGPDDLAAIRGRLEMDEGLSAALPGHAGLAQHVADRATLLRILDAERERAERVDGERVAARCAADDLYGDLGMARASLDTERRARLEAEGERNRFRVLLSALVNDCADTPMIDSLRWQDALAALTPTAAKS